MRRLTTFFEPCGDGIQFGFTAGYAPSDTLQFGVVGRQPATVQLQEERGRSDAGPFVAIDKGMVADDGFHERRC